MKTRTRRLKPGQRAHGENPPARLRDPYSIMTKPAVDRSEWPLSNPRRELFAQNIAKGMNRADAYLDAGYRLSGGTRGAMHAMIHDPEVEARIVALQKRAAAKAVVTMETLVAELEEARELAKEGGQAAAMVSATKEKGILLGLRVERKDLTVRPGDPKGLTDDELAAIARAGGDGDAAAPGDTERPKPLVH